MRDVTVDNAGKTISETILGRKNSSQNMPHHLLDCCFVWAAAILCIMNQSDGTLSLRRVGCRGHGFGVYSMVEGIISNLNLVIIL